MPSLSAMQGLPFDFTPLGEKVAEPQAPTPAQVAANNKWIAEREFERIPDAGKPLPGLAPARIAGQDKIPADFIPCDGRDLAPQYGALQEILEQQEKQLREQFRQQFDNFQGRVKRVPPMQVAKQEQQDCIMRALSRAGQQRVQPMYGSLDMLIDAPLNVDHLHYAGSYHAQSQTAAVSAVGLPTSIEGIREAMEKAITMWEGKA